LGGSSAERLAGVQEGEKGEEAGLGEDEVPVGGLKGGAEEIPAAPTARLWDLGDGGKEGDISSWDQGIMSLV
jgi:hypothetical protein